MPKRKRHQPGKYKPKPEIGPNFIGTKPLTLSKPKMDFGVSKMETAILK